jgi:hypothetical protein
VRQVAGLTRGGRGGSRTRRNTPARRISGTLRGPEARRRNACTRALHSSILVPNLGTFLWDMSGTFRVPVVKTAHVELRSGSPYLAWVVDHAQEQVLAAAR